MAYDHGLVERMRDVLARLSLRHVREKHVFGGWGFMDGRSLFAVAGDEGLILKVAPTEYADVLRLPGVVPFAPMGERAMTTWVVASDESTADDEDLSAWIQRALRGVRAVPSGRGTSTPRRNDAKGAGRRATTRRPPRPPRRTRGKD